MTKAKGEFVHYWRRDDPNPGFNCSRFYPIYNRNNFGIKPFGGFWACRSEDDWPGWDPEWIEPHYDLGNPFYFDILKVSRIYTIASKKDLKNLLIRTPGLVFPASLYYIDFEKLASEYDAIELVNEPAVHYELCGWDCNCMLIFNPKIIIPRC